MESVAQKGRRIFDEGYACSEATWLALNDDLPRELYEFGLRLSNGFRGGFCTEHTCGAICGIVMSLSRRYGKSLVEEENQVLREKVRALVDYVEENYPSVNCRDLKQTHDNWRECCSELVGELLDYSERLFD